MNKAESHHRNFDYPADTSAFTRGGRPPPPPFVAALTLEVPDHKDNHMERHIGKSPLNPPKSRSDILASKEVLRSNHPDNRYVAMSRSEARS